MDVAGLRKREFAALSKKLHFHAISSSKQQSLFFRLWHMEVTQPVQYNSLTRSVFLMTQDNITDISEEGRKGIFKYFMFIK